MTALLDAAEIAERLATQAEVVDNMSDDDAAALRLLAQHARESDAGDVVRTATAVETIEYVAGGSYAQGVADERARQAAELDAWKRLATLLDWRPHERTTRTEVERALNALCDMGIDPATGERIAAEEPR